MVRMAAKSAGQEGEITKQVAHHHKALEKTAKRLSRIYDSLENRLPLLETRADGNATGNARVM